MCPTSYSDLNFFVYKMSCRESPTNEHITLFTPYGLQFSRQWSTWVRKSSSMPVCRFRVRLKAVVEAGDGLFE
uniref:Uncharacterized protein n=1 Tax=Lepeophtheirus salmonis TaxID=72036 RepID=A0A0K2T2S2_LEPSM